MLDDATPADSPSPDPADSDATAEGEPRTTPPLTRLDPKARTAQWISDSLVSIGMAAAATYAEQRWILPHPSWPFEQPLVAWIGGSMLLLLAIVYPPFWYRGWGYALRDHDILVCHGVLWRVRRAVPRRRIQHADIQSGPIDRWFGLCSLTLYTAGSGDEDASIPGLTVEIAEALCDQLLRPDDRRDG